VDGPEKVVPAEVPESKGARLAMPLSIALPQGNPVAHLTEFAVLPTSH
jgi:hypothetical protein